ncbi:uncharacterized protein LOC127282041 [Leptopilina boulardi]|uniref:uncharacterized protein LOC127282041 n=1 Tax=Leptopilina boulardi TaxID=63433 RepID=UPI0021F5AA03|nr:uncharacterized protein LOC127282041 [Leptopilina boulardi]
MGSVYCGLESQFKEDKEDDEEEEKYWLFVNYKSDLILPYANKREEAKEEVKYKDHLNRRKQKKDGVENYKADCSKQLQDGEQAPDHADILLKDRKDRMIWIIEPYYDPKQRNPRLVSDF